MEYPLTCIDKEAYETRGHSMTKRYNIRRLVERYSKADFNKIVKMMGLYRKIESLNGIATVDMISIMSNLSFKTLKKYEYLLMRTIDKINERSIRNIKHILNHIKASLGSNTENLRYNPSNRIRKIDLKSLDSDTSYNDPFQLGIVGFNEDPSNSHQTSISDAICKTGKTDTTCKTGINDTIYKNGISDTICKKGTSDTICKTDTSDRGHQSKFHPENILLYKDSSPEDMVTNLQTRTIIWEQSFLNTLDTTSTPFTYSTPSEEVISKYQDEVEWVTSRRERWIEGRSTTIRTNCHGRSIVTMIKVQGNSVYTSSDDCLVCSWNIKTGELEGTFKGHQGAVWCFILTDQYLITGSTDTKIRIWTLDGFECQKILTGHTATVRCIESICSNVFVSGGRDGVINVWDMEGSELGRLFGHTDSIRKITVLNRGRIASGSYDGTIRIWDIHNKECKYILDGDGGRVYNICFDGDRLIYCSYMNASIKIWDVDSGEYKGDLNGHTKLSCWISLDKNKGNIITGSLDRNIIFWNKWNNSKIHKKVHGNPITLLESNGDFLISGDSNCVKLWNIKEKVVIRNLVKGSNDVWCCLIKKDYYIICYQRNFVSKMDIVSFLE
eukprot:GHVP01056617.1.p1 GENE.GHVP01056617.1~~GHVP01056617.1.p1  ORF type:complete len:612 (-),score=48.69 GHVP01056617.1:12-1847(-)